MMVKRVVFFLVGALPVTLMAYTITATNSNTSGSATFTAEPAVYTVVSGKKNYCPKAGAITPKKVVQNGMTIGCEYTLPTGEKNLSISNASLATVEYFYTAGTNCSQNAAGWGKNKYNQMVAHMSIDGGIRLSVGAKDCSISPGNIPVTDQPVFYAMPQRQINLGQNYFDNGTLSLLALNNNVFSYDATQGKYTTYTPKTAGQFAFSKQICTASSKLCGPEGVLQLHETFSGSGTHKLYTDTLQVNDAVLDKTGFFADLSKTTGCQASVNNKDILSCRIPITLSVPGLKPQTQNFKLFVYQGIRAKTIAELSYAEETGTKSPTSVTNPIQYAKTRLDQLNVPGLFDLNGHHVYYFLHVSTRSYYQQWLSNQGSGLLTNAVTLAPVLNLSQKNSQGLPVAYSAKETGKDIQQAGPFQINNKTGQLTYLSSAPGAGANLYEITIDALYHVRVGDQYTNTEVATQTVYVGKADPKTSPFLQNHMGNSIYVYI